MNRVFVLIGLAFSNALRGIRSASTTSLMAVLTIAIVLVLVGGAALLVHNMSSILDEFGTELQLTAYLEEGLSEAEQRDLVERVAAAPGVERVELVTKEMALERFVEIAGSEALLAGLEENPLPASLEIQLRPEARTAEAIGILEASLDGLPGIDDFAQGREWIEGYARAVSMVRIGVVAIAIVLGMAALLIVANTIRLALYARQDELEILALVGASRTFVRVPFLLEGTLQGLLGGALALFVVWGAFEWLQPQLREGLELVVGRAELHFFTTAEALWLVVSGAALGLAGSIMALVGGRT
ncbi:MAG TPA: ABC transporter permease [Deltaproteobacteria bacterium]|nr:ABC transporter permease [Deltaproteobacteria bacterium]